MDIFAHGLWTAAAAKETNNRLRQAQPIKIFWATVWGVIPDLFAFTLPFTIFFWNIAIGKMRFADFPGPESNAAATNLFEAGITHALYSLSHSLIVFAVAFAIIWLIRKKPVLEMLGWLLHILIDIPTHSYRFYPTPFLWPVSDLKLNGHSWADPKFMLINYSLLAVVYLIIIFRKIRSS